MYDTVITSWNISIGINFHTPDIEISALLYVLVPWVSISEPWTPCMHSIDYICDAASQSCHTNFSTSHTFFTDIFAVPQGYFYFYVLQLFEYYYNQTENYSFHSSCIAKNGNAIMLVGEFGSWKSTCAFHMHMHTDYQLISNNRTLISSSKEVLAGTTVASFKQDFKTLNKEMYEYYLAQSMIELYKDRIFIKDVINFEPAKLRKIVWVKINPTVAEKRYFTKEEAIELYLYNSLSRLIGGECVLFEWKTPSESFDTYKMKQARLNFLWSIIENNDFVFLSGSLEYIWSEIDKLI